MYGPWSELLGRIKNNAEDNVPYQDQKFYNHHSHFYSCILMEKWSKEGVTNFTFFLRWSLMLSNSHTRTFSVASDGFLLLKNAIAAGKMPWPLWRQASLEDDKCSNHKRKRRLHKQPKERVGSRETGYITSKWAQGLQGVGMGKHPPRPWQSHPNLLSTCHQSLSVAPYLLGLL